MVIGSVFFFFFFKHKRTVQVPKWQRLFFLWYTNNTVAQLKISLRQLRKRLAYCGSSDWPGLYNNSLEKLSEKIAVEQKLNEMLFQRYSLSLLGIRSGSEGHREIDASAGESPRVSAGCIPCAQHIYMMQLREVYHLEESLLFESWHVRDSQKSSSGAPHRGSREQAGLTCQESFATEQTK